MHIVCIVIQAVLIVIYITPLTRYPAAILILYGLSICNGILCQMGMLATKSYAVDLATLVLFWNLCSLQLLPVGLFIVQVIISLLISIIPTIIIYLLPNWLTDYGVAFAEVTGFIALIIIRICMALVYSIIVFFETYIFFEEFVSADFFTLTILTFLTN